MDDLFGPGTDTDDTDDDGDGTAGSAGRPASPRSPLAVRMRPRTLDDVVGQQHLLGAGSPLRQLAAGTDATGPAGPSSLILWGLPAPARPRWRIVIAKGPGRKFVELSAITAGVKDVRRVMEEALTARDLFKTTTVLFLDEIHRFNKAQQDALLPGVENRWVVLVAATTENPSFSVVAPLLSRSLLLTLKPLTDADIESLLLRAVDRRPGPERQGRAQRRGHGPPRPARRRDARRALTALEAAAGAAFGDADDADAATAVTVGLRHTERALDQSPPSATTVPGTSTTTSTSAFIKSIRGSDVDAALHYLARMLEAGEDPRFVARRIVISAAEDIGMADPTALQTAVAAAQAVQLIGMPEGRIVLAAGRGAPGHRAEIQRRHTWASTRRSPMSGPAWETAFPPTCATRTTRGVQAAGPRPGLHLRPRRAALGGHPAVSAG